MWTKNGNDRPGIENAMRSAVLCAHRHRRQGDASHDAEYDEHENQLPKHSIDSSYLTFRR